jgi:hypothetical protein
VTVLGLLEWRSERRIRKRLSERETADYATLWGEPYRRLGIPPMVVEDVLKMYSSVCGVKIEKLRPSDSIDVEFRSFNDSISEDLAMWLTKLSKTYGFTEAETEKYYYPARTIDDVIRATWAMAQNAKSQRVIDELPK